ncbi:helix-turn-helix domain-containing protein [Acuticoccus sediminis]|uniref:helix-turn-helix domain-containing protein n=1 Tax=Acuticoccus sediminis TaxID=2184697 RepID=UPI001FD3C024|nr:helix-turn-helix domain-containing protein [Acuticoccus sediminis]
MSLLSANDDTIVGQVHKPKATRSTTEIDAHVGSMVKIRRIELDMTQEKLANMLGITPQQLQKYERGTNRIGASRLYRISVILDVPIQYFFRNMDQIQHAMDDDGPDNFLAVALGDAATFRLLRMFANVRDPALKRRILSLVEVVIGED